MIAATSDAAGRVAVVTGGSGGIGLSTVERLLEAGWRVGFFSQQADRVSAALAALADRGFGDRIHGDTVDLREADQVAAFFTDLERRWSGIAALVCNAGYSPKGPNGRSSIADIDPQEWDDVLRVNLTGAFLCCRQVLPGMARRGMGRIVLIGSVAGRTLPRIAGAGYVASKSALTGFARSIVSEYGKSGVTANTVCPGRIVSDMTGAPDAPGNRAALERIPIGRLGQPDDVARVVEFLVRPESDFINGAVIDVNGGEFVAP